MSDKRTFLIIILIIGSVVSMQYQEPLAIDDFNTFFIDDGCVEGSLRLTETGSPVIRTVSLSTENHSTKDSFSQSEILTGNTNEKSPMSRIAELATFNNIKHLYKLVEEDGPDHKKRFVIVLELGNEEFMAQGTSIKKAQHEAAKRALNSTLYLHPEEKKRIEVNPKPKNNHVELLSSWASKRTDTLVVYNYLKQTEPENSKHSHHHSDMYSEARNVHKVMVKILDKEFIGKGQTSEIAKEEAAKAALNALQKTEAFCMFDDGTKSIIDRIMKLDSHDSAISLLFEFASKSKLATELNLFSESGPSHMKTFVFKCTVGDKFETFGEGTSKKAAKNKAASKMIEQLKSHAIYNENCPENNKLKKKQKNKAPKNLVKQVKNKESEDEPVLHYIPENIDPVSKLMQLQQSKHELPPVFKLIEERGDLKKEFFMEATIGTTSFVGSGPNKKSAKKNAAQGLLVKMGYETPSGEIRIYSSSENKKDFEEKDISNKQPLLSGLNIKSEKLTSSVNNNHLPKNDDAKPPPSTIDHQYKKDQFSDTSKESNNEPNNQKQRPYGGSKDKLVQLSNQMGFRLQFSDFPKGNNTGFVSLVSLTTDPPKVCYGTSETVPESQENASSNALKSLYKSQLDSISRLLNDHPQEIEPQQQTTQEWYIIDGKTVLSTSITKETE